MEKKKKSKQIEVKELVKEQIHLKIRGTTPLLVEKMDESVVEKYNKKKAMKLTEKDTRLEEEKLDSKLHFTEEGNIGFPASGFAKGMIEVAPYLGLYKKDVRGSVRVLGNIIPIDFKERVVNVSWGRQSGISKAPMKIVRPEFREWKCELDLVVNTGVISIEQVINLINWAGFQQGLGSWRPEKGGSYGQYEVAK